MDQDFAIQHIEAATALLTHASREACYLGMLYKVPKCSTCCKGCCKENSGRG